MKTRGLILLAIVVLIISLCACHSKKKTVEAKLFNIYETEIYLIVYGDIQHLDIKDKQGNIVASEDMQQTISTKKLNKGETYNLYITAKDSTKAIQSFTKTY